MALGTIISGVLGSVTIPKGAAPATGLGFTTAVLNSRIIRWSLSITRETHQTSTFALSDNFHTFVGGMASFTGRAEGYQDSGEAIDTADLEVEDMPAAEFVLFSTASRQYTFNAIITGLEMGVDKVATAPFSITFRGSGPIVPT